MEKKFKPMLATDSTDVLEDLRYPKLASFKLDGIRAVFKDGQCLSRSLKAIPNKQLRNRFKHLMQLTAKGTILIDGEFYAHNRTFQEITRAVMTQDFDDEKTIKKIMKSEKFDTPEQYFAYTASLIEDITYNIFDCIATSPSEMFRSIIKNVMFNNERYTINVTQTLVHSHRDVTDMFKQALAQGFEGLILRDPDAGYKFGRSTLKEEIMLKVKPFKTFDARITGVVQATEVDPDAERKTNELGRSVTSRKKDDRIPINKAAAFTVEYEGVEQKVSIAEDDSKKEEIWMNRESYIGKMLEFKGMTYGSKNAIRHPVSIRIRGDRE
jgi:DNA ligase-1